MATFMRALAALTAFLLQAQSAELRASTRATATANPVRKVITLLQKMQKKVEAQGEAEEDLYKKFMCYCKTGVSELKERIEAADGKAPQLEASIKASEEQLAQAEQALKGAQEERADAKDAIASATAIREKDAKTFAGQKAESEGIVSQIAAAVKALESGAAGSLLQTSTAQSLKRLVDRVDIADDDKEELISFLSGKQVSSYAPMSGEVVGILKQMGESFAKGLQEAQEAETKAISEFEAVVAAKKKEIEVLTASIESKLEKVGELGTAIVSMKADLEDVAGNILEDKKLLAELEKGCAGKDAEYAERVKTRNEELLAISETVKILNDDDALELFKKTLPAPSAALVQIQVTAADVRQRAAEVIRKAPSASGRARLNFLLLALHGKKTGFEKVISMIDAMVESLQKEGVDDVEKKEYCLAELDSGDDKKKVLERKLSDTETAVASVVESVAVLSEEIPEVEKSVKALDSSVKEATAIRKAENEEYEALVQSDSAAKELLGFAKNRLNKFYNPKLYNPPAKKELSEMGAVSRDMEGAASFMQVKEHARRGAIDPLPETWDAYTKKSEESAGAIAMIDLLMKDLDKDLTEAEVEEKNAQEEYDKFVADAKTDRISLSKSLKEKVAAKADLEEDLLTLKATTKSTGKELMATEKYISDLHGECDWLLKYFDVRVEARSGETDALTKAKAVLSGASYSLLQTGSGLRHSW